MKIEKFSAVSLLVWVCAGISSAQAGDDLVNRSFYDKISKKEVQVCRIAPDGGLMVAEVCRGFPSLESRQRGDLIASVEEIDGLKVGQSRALAMTGKPARWVYSKVYRAWEDGSVLIVQMDSSRIFPEPNRRFVVHSSQLIPEVETTSGLRRDESYCLRSGGYDSFTQGQRLKVVSLFKNGFAGVKTDYWGDRIWPSLSSDGLVLAADLRPCGDSAQVSERRSKVPASDADRASGPDAASAATQAQADSAR